jgi:hypothetical protein
LAKKEVEAHLVRQVYQVLPVIKVSQAPLALKVKRAIKVTLVYLV